jgi:ankyrin repeat protein
MFSTLRGDEAGVNSKAVKAVTDFLASETTTRAHTVLIRMTDEEGRTALHFATARNMGQAVSDLLRHGADPEAATNSLTRITALHIASQRGLVDIVTTLLSAQYRKQAIRGALSVASANGHSDIVALLIAAARDAADEEHSNEHAKAGQRTATTTSTATTSPLWRSGTLPPLHAAASRGRRTIVRQLLLAGSGANSLSAGSTGYTALSLACKGAHVDVVRDLLLAGADPNVQNIQLRSKSMSDKPENAPSALALAAASSSEACVNLLLSNPIPAKITFEALSTKTSGTIRSILRAARRPDAAPVDVAASGRVASSSSKSSYSWACDMIDGADLTMVRKVGEGTTKIVWQADMRTGAGPVTVAAMLFKDPDYDSCKLSLHHEALTMALPYHPNVAGLVGVCAERKCIVTEFVNGDVVYDKLHTPPEPTWPLLKRMMLVRDIVRGLSFLHTHGVSHGDLSSRNVMTEASSGTAKLIDFGCARVRSGLGNLGLIRRGAPLWMPPEVLSAPEVQEASSLDVYAVDVYSFGILAHEVLSGAVPFMSRDSDDDPLTWDAVRRLVCDDGAKPDMSLVRAKAVPEHAVDLMLRCLAPLPSDRPTAVSLEREWELLVQATVDGGGAPALLECVVCLDAPRSSALGCGHAVCCSPCARSLRHRGLGCPVCRACVSRVVNVSSRDVTKTYDPSLLS